jgi:hypothetical protein
MYVAIEIPTREFRVWSSAPKPSNNVIATVHQMPLSGILFATKPKLLKFCDS